MTTNNFAPDQVYALGGGGKELAFTFLEQDWIVDEILRPRAANPEQVRVTILDTASEEVNQDAQTVQDIEATCDALTEEYVADASGIPGDIDVERLLLTENIQMADANTLTSPRAVERYAAVNGMDVDDWWLDKGDIEENLNFSRGVIRRRALAKATFYRATSERPDVENVIDAPEAGSIAIFVGLGGGSGAGILFDVIQTLAEKSPNSEITVFGVIPSERENSDGVHANAYAALCELEALRLGDDDPLKDVVLYPLDPTDYGGKDGNVHDTSPALDEFDAVFAQSVIAYYNAQGEDQFNQTPSFAPFTVAVPQAIHYNAHAFDEAQEHMEAYLTAYSDALDAEANVANGLSQYFAGQGMDASDGEDLSQADRSYLSNRLEDLLAVAREDLFTEMEFVSGETFLEQYGQATDGNLSVTTDPVEVVTRLQEYLAPLGRADREFKTDLDAQLMDILLREVDLVARWAELLSLKNALPDTKLQSKLGDFATWRHHSGPKLADDAMWLSSRVDSLAADLEEAKATLEDAREQKATAAREASQAIDRAVTTWLEETETAREALQSHDLADLEDRLDDVHESLMVFADRLAAAESKAEADGIEREQVIETVDAVNAYVENRDPQQTGHRPLIDPDEVDAAIESLVTARKLTLDIADGPGLVERVFGIGQTGATESEGAALRDYKDRTRDLEDGGVFELTGSPDEFTARVTFDPATYREVVTGWVDDHRDLLVSTAERVSPEDVPAVDEMDTNYLTSSVSAGDDGEQALVEVYESNLATRRDQDERITDLEAFVDEVEHEHDRYAACYDAVQDIRSKHLGAYERAMSAVKEAEAAYEQVRSRLASDEEFIYRKTVQPVNLVSGKQSASMAEAALLDDDAELQRFSQSMNELLANVVNPAYNGLVERRLTGAETSYYGTDINVGLLSPAADAFDGDAHGITDRLSEAFAVKAPGQPTDAVGVYRVRDDRRDAVGSPWDFGFHVFVSGVFLDNLKYVTDRGRTAYETLLNGRDVPHIHHAFRLEDGVTVSRRDHVNVRDDASLALYLGDDEQAIVSRLEDDYITERPIRPESDDVETSGSGTDTGGPDLDERRTNGRDRPSSPPATEGSD